MATPTPEKQESAGRKRDGGGRLSRQARTTAMIVASALFMEQLDSTVLTTALPTMARAFHTDPLHMSAALTAYLLSLAVLIPASGRMADRFGSRSVFRGAIALFTLGSLLCAQADGLRFLVAARLIQGAGGAMMVPVGRLVLLRSVEKSEMVSAMFWMLVPAALGPLLGPPVGGFLTTYLSWRWIFYVNLPVGVLAMLLTTRFIPQIRESAGQPFDVAGLVLSGAGLACLVFGLELATRVGLSAGVGSLLVVGCLCALLYRRHARRLESPILDLALMRIPTFRISVLSGGATRVAMGATPFLLPSLLQLQFGVSAAGSGLVTFTGVIGSLLMRLAARRVLRDHGYRSVMAANGVGMALLTVACAAFQPGWPLWMLSLVLVMGGFSQALQFTALNTIAYADVPSARMSAATSLYATLQQLTLTLGISIAAASLSISRVWRNGAGTGHADFVTAFVVVGLISLLAVPVALMLSPDAGAEISGHRPRT